MPRFVFRAATRAVFLIFAWTKLHLNRNWSILTTPPDKRQPRASVAHFLLGFRKQFIRWAIHILIKIYREVWPVFFFVFFFCCAHCHFLKSLWDNYTHILLKFLDCLMGISCIYFFEEFLGLIIYIFKIKIYKWGRPVFLTNFWRVYEMNYTDILLKFHSAFLASIFLKNSLD